MKPHIALLTFSETRDEFYEKRRAIVAAEMNKVSGILGDVLDLESFPEIRSRAAAIDYFKQAKATGPDAYILHLPIWSEPQMAVSIARLADAPVLLLGNDRLETSSLVCTLAVGGGLDQCGIGHKRILGDITKEDCLHDVVAFCRAAYAQNHLKGSTLGCFGGRSIGICTTIADASQLQKLFGVDVEQIDQSEIIREAELIDEQDINLHMQWLENTAGSIEYDGTTFTKDKLRKQVASYLAIKKIVADKKLDGIGVKCQTDLSDHYCLQCVGISLLNDNFDAKGEKKTVPCSCEADMDGALTMMILRLISDGKPTTLMDVRYYYQDEKVFVFANCGSMAPSFAGGKDAKENWSKIHLIPHIFGKAGGAATQFVAGDKKLTVARLCRRDGQYWMGIFTGESIEKDREELRKTTWSYPHVFLKTELDFEDFTATFSSNHAHAVEGEYTQELINFCQMLGIPYRLYN